MNGNSIAEQAGHTFDAGNALMRPIVQKQAANALAAGAMLPTPFGAMMVPGQAGTMYRDDPQTYNALAMHGGPTKAAAAAANWDPGSVRPDVAAGIVETARSLGIDPVDLATAISYETGGTFNPMKKGPTTQWGQHEGLLQFGQPQQRRHGVDLSSPDAAVASQLGAGGAVASYLRSAGVQPGMGLLDIYSAINAGSPGLYNRSDADNGGAPGTVRDKVENQMVGHRAKAEALLKSFGL